jgi:Spy/CpxP family protein refolding chaperone
MKMKFQARLGAALVAALIVPVLAFSQGPAPDADDPGGLPGPPAMMPGFGHEGPGGPMGHSRRGGPGMGMGHQWGGHEMGLGWLINNPKLREQLGITSEQAAKIRQETLGFQIAEIRSRAELQVKRLELHSLLAAETPDRVAIDKALQEANAAQFGLEKAAIDHRLAMRGMLTPEQHQKLQQLKEEFGHRDAGPHGPRGQHGPMHPGEGGMMHPGAHKAPPAPNQQQQ